MASSWPTCFLAPPTPVRPHQNLSRQHPLSTARNADVRDPIDRNLRPISNQTSRSRATARLARLRIDTCTAGQACHLHSPPSYQQSLSTPKLGESFSISETNAGDFPSAPIAIPRHQSNVSRPSTPLTARAPEGGHFQVYDHSENHRLSRSFQPISPTRPARRSSHNLDTASPESDEISNTSSTHSHSRSSSLYRPFSPLSPTMPLSPLPPKTDARTSKRPAKNLHLPSLPRFHPANYQSPDLNHAHPPRAPRPGSSSRQFSDAQQQLHLHQRDLVANAARFSRSVVTQGLGTKPSPPRLQPLGSPGPVTPMMLEEHGDYLSAGTDGGNEDDSQGDGNGIFQKLTREDSERMRHAGLHLTRQSSAKSLTGLTPSYKK